MKQLTLASAAASSFELVSKRTRKREFLRQMNLVAPWAKLVRLIQPVLPSSTVTHVNG
jgi:IS5 family transposase